MIHETVIQEGPIEVGESVSIGPYCRLIGPIKIGKGVIIDSHSVIGGRPECRNTVRNGLISIGDYSEIREHVTVDGPAFGQTIIGASCLILKHSHIGHDAILEQDVTLSPYSKIGGHVRIMKGAYIGMGSAIHQWTIFGPYSCSGMQGAVCKDVPPLCTVGGVPAKYLKVNKRAMERLSEPFESIWNYYQIARRNSTRKQILDLSEEEWTALVTHQ